MPDRATCRELPWEDGGCPMMMDLGQGYTCTSETWPCQRMAGGVRRVVADPELEQGWEVVKRYGPAFARYHGDEATGG